MFFDPRDALRSYNYLRLGIVLAVIMLAAAIRYEVVRTPAFCDFQTSISGYYYTPVRAVFVGVLVAIGLSLIVIKGDGLEDLFLNLAGVLAPVVAFVPTVNIGPCYSFESFPKPVEDGVLQPWVVANVSNNLHAMAVAGAVAVGFSLVFYLIQHRNKAFEVKSEIFTLIGLAVMAGLVLFGFLYLRETPNYKSVRATHNVAAIAMFVFLAGAAGINGWRLWGREGLTLEAEVRDQLLGHRRPYGSHRHRYMVDCRKDEYQVGPFGIGAGGDRDWTVRPLLAGADSRALTPGRSLRTCRRPAGRHIGGGSPQRPVTGSLSLTTRSRTSQGVRSVLWDRCHIESTQPSKPSAAI